MKRVAACLGMLALAGCNYLTSSFDTNDSSGDQFPIFVDNASGAVVIGMQEAGDLDQRQAVLDVMSPLTVVDRGPVAPASITETNVSVLGTPVPGGDLTLPRGVRMRPATGRPRSSMAATCAPGTGSPAESRMRPRTVPPRRS